MEPPKINTTYFVSVKIWSQKNTNSQMQAETNNNQKHLSTLSTTGWSNSDPFWYQMFKFNNTLPPHFLCLFLHENCGDSLSNTIVMVQKLSWEETANIHLTNDIIRHGCLCSVKITQAKNAMQSHHPASNKYLKWTEYYTPVSQSWIIWTITKHTRQC